MLAVAQRSALPIADHLSGSMTSKVVEAWRLEEQPVREVPDRGQTRLCRRRGGGQRDRRGSPAHIQCVSACRQTPCVYSGDALVACEGEQDEPGQLFDLRPHMSEQASVSCRSS